MGCNPDPFSFRLNAEKEKVENKHTHAGTRALGITPDCALPHKLIT